REVEQTERLVEAAHRLLVARDTDATLSLRRVVERAIRRAQLVEHACIAIAPRLVEETAHQLSPICHGRPPGLSDPTVGIGVRVAIGTCRRAVARSVVARGTTVDFGSQRIDRHCDGSVISKLLTGISALKLNARHAPFRPPARHLPVAPRT